MQDNYRNDLSQLGQEVANATEERDAARLREQERLLEAENEPEQATQDDVLGPDEMWIRLGNNKKWRAPAVEKNRKKMAKASKKRNRRK